MASLGNGLGLFVLAPAKGFMKPAVASSKHMEALLPQPVRYLRLRRVCVAGPPQHSAFVVIMVGRSLANIGECICCFDVVPTECWAS